MSHHKIRTEKNCLNCGSIVEERFCPHCGQENIEDRQPSHYLITHFFEDLFHYDGQFWKTMKVLMFRPGKIVNDYLSGKRKSYVPPVKLYIFVSFVVFFLPLVLPDFKEKEEKESVHVEQDAESLKENIKKDFEGIEVAGFKNVKTIKQLDSIQNSLPENKKISSIEYNVLSKVLTELDDSVEKADSLEDDYAEFSIGNENSLKGIMGNGISFGDKYKSIKTVEQFDSIHYALSKEDRMNWFFKKGARKIIEMRERSELKGEKLAETFYESFMHKLPKAMFFYLPFFALVLWVFQSKKKWLYYDHGIFTLYFFSFQYILVSLFLLLNFLLYFVAYYFPATLGFVDIIIGFLLFGIFFYPFIYFLIAHNRVYKEQVVVSFIKANLILLVNFIVFFFFSLFYVIFIAFSI